MLFIPVFTIRYFHGISSEIYIRSRHSIKGQAQRPCRVWLELLKAYLNAHSVTISISSLQSK